MASILSFKFQDSTPFLKSNTQEVRINRSPSDSYILDPVINAVYSGEKEDRVAENENFLYSENSAEDAAISKQSFVPSDYLFPKEFEQFELEKETMF